MFTNQCGRGPMFTNPYGRVPMFTNHYGGVPIFINQYGGVPILNQYGVPVSQDYVPSLMIPPSPMNYDDSSYYAPNSMSLLQ